jgi:hypothetical protein
VVSQEPAKGLHAPVDGEIDEMRHRVILGQKDRELAGEAPYGRLVIGGLSGRAPEQHARRHAAFMDEQVEFVSLGAEPCRARPPNDDVEQHHLPSHLRRAGRTAVPVVLLADGVIDRSAPQVVDVRSCRSMRLRMAASAGRGKRSRVRSLSSFILP